MDSLKDQLKLLICLQELDSHILEKQLTINEIPSKVSESELPLKNALAVHNKIKQGYETLDKKKRDKERSLDEIDEKIKKLKSRTTEIKTNKEYQAHLKEIESVDKERYSLEDEILAIMEEMDASLKELNLFEENIKSEKNKVEEFKKKLGAEVLEAENKLSSLQEEKSKIVDALDEELYNLYINLMNANNGLAVTEAKEAVCQGCNMNIPPQLFVELKKNEDIIQCPQCHRILYFKNNQ